MTDRETGSAADGAVDPAGLDAGTYEVLRKRLAEQAAELTRRAELLNVRRLEVFGSTELRLVSTERIRTEHNCVPRDIVPVGGLMLFGYNVFIGLKPETTVDDVFSLHRFVRAEDAGADGFRFDQVDPAEVPGLLRDPQFERDFAELYRYYRQTRLLQLRRLDGRLLAVFQTGPRTDDIRVLRWRIDHDGTVAYLDNRGERDHVFPPAHDFEWIATTRDDHVLGRHPHISIQGEVFVETVGGNLTVKVENNTETGEGVYSEPVDEPLQSLADADVSYARVGPLILLRILPYKETDWRHLVFNTLTREVVRLDGIGQACQRLPEDHGIIFPGGYHLATGLTRTFDTDVSRLEFERVVRAPNGEDVLYVFHARDEGRSLLLPYNAIRKEVSAPIPCHGYSIFDDGTMVVFRAISDEPTRVHPMQVWQTPYASESYAAAQPAGTGPLERIGNADLVRGISDCLSVARMADATTPAAGVYQALIAAGTRAFDHYHWLDDPELGNLAEPLAAVRATAAGVLDEYEKVRSLTGQAAQAVDESAERIASLTRRVRGEAPLTADEWVRQLAGLRQAQGHLVTLRELRYVDLDRVDELAVQLDGELAEAGRRAVDFLRRDDALTGYRTEVERLGERAAAITTVAEATPVRDELAERAEGLQTITEVVGGLDIADATVRTGILARIGEVLGGVNRARAVLENRRRELTQAEGRAGFAAEFALLGQAVTGALAAADTPERCDEQLGRLLLQVENLESRFGEFDDFLAELATRRADIYEAFSSRKQALLDERARRADRLVASADRILLSVQRRVATLDSLDQINTYFASDPMVGKLRSVVDELRTVGDQVRAEELDGRIRAARQEAGRTLRDRTDLYADGGETIRLGPHRFAVNTQPVDVTVVPHQGRMAVAVTGTDYRSPVRDESFERTRRFWDQLLVSESPEVYRAEYLATSILADAEAGRGTLTLDALHAAAVDGGKLAELVRAVADTRYDEGYERGVHDQDATAILHTLLRLHAAAGLLRWPPAARAAAQLFWRYGTDEAARRSWSARAVSLARARDRFGRPTAHGAGARGVVPGAGPLDGPLGSGRPEPGAAGAGAVAGEDQGTEPPVIGGDAIDRLRAELATRAARWLRDAGLPGLAAESDLAGGYLLEELARAPFGFVTGAGARGLLERFRRALGGPQARSSIEFDEDLRALGDDLASRYQLVEAWLGGFLATAGGELSGYDLPEAIAVELCGPELPRHESAATLTETVTGLLGAHPRIDGSALTLRLDETLARTHRFRTERVPAFRDYQRRRNELVAAERERLRLAEYQPKVMSTFVRNRLLDEVYLPLIGDNLARQLGATGDAKRVDQMGLLLLISPPGYGKTTLMEYVASRLGLVFVKVNGPALGSRVTSLDPAEAPDATARQEVEKISFALELGNNVLLYLDDIQHTSPELLQKFIPLCDAQRRMEGVWEGRTRTYDLRGKRFAVCMAGNPYTESGQRFRVPDMLANRADVWNLGDVLSGRDEAFALSYIENALTSNPTLAPLSARDRGDVELLVRLARGDETVRAEQLSHPYSAVELEGMVAVLRKLLHVQRVVLTNNQAYIASAAQADSSRTEPPYQLQGSYRNMNKLAERVVPVLTDEELEAVIDDHYLGEAQTLAAGAEANLLKLAELRGRLSPEQARRWVEVKAAFVRARMLGGSDDPLDRAVGAIGLLADRVGGVEAAIGRASGQRT
ncbi:AAA domain-containing protein [Micromonospora sp. PPF5-17]|uniref:AAA family ATPase n=1 Tax=Micromonospora solifontis TaxID=2487138 RepID=A0ABX9WGJ6_9ACTN|nr:AAA domain-containing protein [Micromonospora sp. PPF5-17B]NES36768.1 AAA domain-containing protein [Micromonospora solifontis]NES56374.1 AAA domain-containing protein [Micromonospora sp. PPF5-6]RNL99099.1 AAA family ATPase [Micromonospora solifontis]